MRSRSTSSTPVATVDQLLDALRVSNLCSLSEMIPRDAAVSCGWPDAGTWARELVDRGALTPYQAEQLLAGQSQALVLGQYRILDRAGTGGMGQVYKAEHVLLKRTVAIKVMAAHVADDPQVVKRFRREAWAAAQLCHPNVVMLHDAAETNGLHFLVMEFVDGMDLDQLVRREGVLAIPAACAYMRQAALGLHHIHERGLAHCDIKPSNLMLSGLPNNSMNRLTLYRDGQVKASHVKILDLGLARYAGLPFIELAGPNEGTEGSQFAGTPEYMAPELAGSCPMPTVRSDLYSLGCTFYYVLTGQLPFPGTTWSETILQHHLDTVRPLREVRPEIPARLAGLVHRLLAKNPHERYASAAEVATHLQDWSGAQDGPRNWCAVEVLTVAHGLPAEDTGPMLPGSRPDLICSSAIQEICPRDAVGGQDAEMSADASPLSPALPSKVNGSIKEHSREDLLLSDASGPALAPRRRAGRISLSFWLMLTAAVTIGLGTAWGLRHPEVVYHASAKPILFRERAPGPFAIDRLPESGFSSLYDALKAAQDGDTIVIHGNEPVRLKPVRIRGKTLSIKAGPDVKPRFIFDRTEAAPDWQPMLASDRPLFLEGLELSCRPEERAARERRTTHLVYAENAALQLTRCRLLAPWGCALVISRMAKDVVVRDCQLAAHSAAIGIEVGGGTLCAASLTGNRIDIGDPEGAALTVWKSSALKPAPVRLHLERNVIHTGRVASLSGLVRGVEVVAHDNRFTFRQSFVSYHGFPPKDGHRNATYWQGWNNRYQGGTRWVLVDGEPVGVHDLADWRRFCSVPEPGSVEEPAEYIIETASRKHPD